MNLSSFTIDAMNYLKSISKPKSKEYVKEERFIEPSINKEDKKNKQTKADDKEWESLMAELEEIGDDNDGKA